MESVREFIQQAQGINLTFEDKARIKQAIERYMLEGNEQLVRTGIFSRIFSKSLTAPFLKYGIINGIWKSFRKGS